MQVKINRLGHGGDGIADGPIYAARTLPGETVQGKLQGTRLGDVKIIVPSAHRIKPQCPAYNRCGGCALHHVAGDYVTDWKARVVRDTLTTQGVPAPLRHVHTSPRNSRRRAKLTGKRTKSGAVVGFHGPRSDVVHDITGCLTLAPAIMGLIPHLQDFTTQYASRKGTLAFWVLDTQTGLDVAIESLPDDKPPTFADMAQWAQSAGIARLSQGDDVVVTFTPPQLTFGSTSVTPPPMGVSQATVPAEQFMQTAVADAVLGARSVVDLFSGCGTFGLSLAQGMAVHAVEGAPDLLAAVDAAVRYGCGLKPVTHEHRDLFRNPLLATELAGFDAVVIDPPRAGAAAQVAEIAQSPVPRVAMVSCNPITFARDAQVLVSGGYDVTWVDVVDQFRWSPHIEIVAQFVKDRKP
ncbi:MAG: class I SAM-dependent RNA methyltransferase [Pseudomonadota bacterium]